MPTLLQLPNDVLSLIAWEIHLRSLLNFRLASKHLNAVALPAICKRRFETRYVMLQQHSLENLLEISRHTVFGPALKTLTICIDHLKKHPQYDHAPLHWGDLARMMAEGDLIPGMPDPSSRGGSEELVVNRPAYESLLEDQKFMMESGLNTAYLTQAIAAFPNLETVVVNNAFQPWGAAAQGRQTSVPMSNGIDGLESNEFVVQTLHRVILAIAANNISLYELDIAIGRLDGGISPDMLVFPRPVLRYIQSHPISLTSLCLSVSPRNSIHPNSELVGDLLGFTALFPGLQRLSLEFNLRDEHEHFPAISQRLRLPGLRFLAIGAVQCTESELVTLLLGQKDSLEEVSFTLIDIISEGGSWQSCLATIRDELSIRLLEMIHCQSADKDVYYCESGSDGVTYLDAFEIGGSWQDWTDSINCITIGKGGN
ncbi:hypothetical protein B0T26DRAFT_728839 [Lasiosphaeria miniovina]|uniref:F-box domain-containing protein n=1 Tax=Lasiosphaeria miniovina TaxID=1954250 RepID=A0AA40A0M9_9PEZI|nr:uncharacterized protein B0T26DRAFT_728839 [Lasiosphaeria miniovina]KAK0707010.1 hypothetical protein B0T26DRAFT_728839 [Lasiosphaeria miniovina]